MMSIDLNADLGEASLWQPGGSDAALLEIVSSANIACGFHAGDALQMGLVVEQALKNNVTIGAHPGFNDREHFGRRRLYDQSAEQLSADLVYQIGALQAIARTRGGRVQQVKLHGALANMVCENFELAQTCVRAIVACDKSLPIVVMPRTELEKAAVQAGCQTIAEIYADRSYNDDATLVSRDKREALVIDPQQAADRMLEVLETGRLTSINGEKIPLKAQTICVHGDNPHALEMAQIIRQKLEDSGIRIASVAP